MQGCPLVPTVLQDPDKHSVMTLTRGRGGRTLTACLQTLQTLCALPGDIRGPSAGLELRLGALEATAALVIGVLTTLTAGGRRGTLRDSHSYHFIADILPPDFYRELPLGYQETAETSLGLLDVEQGEQGEAQHGGD